MNNPNFAIQFLEIRHLNGPNMWTYRPVIEAIVDIGALEDFPSNKLTGFTERLMAFLPSLIEHRCSYGETGGFLKRLQEGTYAAHILEHVTLELQNLAGMIGGFGKARETGIVGIYKVAIRAWHEEVSRLAIHQGRELLLAAINNTHFDVKKNVAELADLAERRLLGPSTQSIVNAATAKNKRIPALRLLETGNLVQLGYGAKSRRIWTAETDETSAIAETISRDKDLTKRLLAACGVPIPEGRIVANADDAWEAAEEIGLPVVVKPIDGNHGCGVFVNLNSAEEVKNAFPKALYEGSEVLVESFIEGHEHRLLVVGDKLIAAARGELISVIADGVSTLKTLVDTQINSDPRRGLAEEYPLDIIDLAENQSALLEITRQGFTPDSVPLKDQEILIVRTGNHTCDITDLVHPEIAETAVLAAKIVGLDIAGVDLVCKNISEPLGAQKGAIVEVNAGPGLLMHLKPENGIARPVGEAIVNHLFPNNVDGRIPVIGITGSYGKTPVAKLVAYLFALADFHVGLACSDGLYLNKRRTVQNNAANYEFAHRVLLNRAVNAAVFENGFEAILTEGLAYDRCQIGVVTNIDLQKHAGQHYIETEEKLFNVFRTQIDLVLPQGFAVLNARENQLVEMGKLCDGQIIYFATDPNLPVMTEHLSAGKCAVIVRYGQIIVACNKGETPLAKLAGIPFIKQNNNADLENVLAAIAVGIAQNIPAHILRTGVETFVA